MAKVLVIDDETLICWSLQQILSAAGHEVMTAGTATEGLMRFGELRPAVVFLDVRLPDANGLTILKSLKDERQTDTAVIVMTSYEAAATATEAMRLGAHKCLTKPFDFDAIAGDVQKALESLAGFGRTRRRPESGIRRRR